MRTRTPLAPVVLAALTAFGAPATGYAKDPRPAFDHYDPVVLNEYAIRSIKEGDHASARILLERASILAPHDKRIARNLALLRTYGEARRAGYENLLSTREARTGADESTVDDVPAEPPPLWAAKLVLP